MPETRKQAAEDNSLADKRRASLKLWATDSLAVTNCQSSYCSTISIQTKAFVINEDHFNFGTIALEIYYEGGTNIWTTLVTAKANNHRVAGSFTIETPIRNCRLDNPNAPLNAYIRAYDHTSSLASGLIRVSVGC